MTRRFSCSLLPGVAPAPLSPDEVRNLAGLYADMTRSGEITGADEAYDTVCGLHGYEIADQVTTLLNEWGVPDNTDRKGN